MRDNPDSIDPFPQDVSFLKDAMEKSSLMGRIPPSLIPDHMAVTEKSMFPPDDTEGRKYWYDEKEQIWVSVIFPSMKPSGRQDVSLLDDWLNRSLAEKVRGSEEYGAL